MVIGLHGGARILITLQKRSELKTRKKFKVSEGDLQRGKPRKNSKRQRGIYKGDKTGNIQSVKGI